jgi:O-antigen ligase/polysaccharide polymerase Wzy-like membrane protein
VRRFRGNAPTAAIIVLAAGVAVLLGILPAAFSSAAALAALVLGLGALAVIIFRSGMRSGLRSPRPMKSANVGGTSANAEGSSAGGPDPVLRVPRLLFYLGALLVTQSSVRVALGLTAAELCFIAAFGLTVVAVLAGRPTSRVPPMLVVGVGLFALGGLISSPNAASPSRSVVEVVQAVYVMLLWAWTAATVLRSRSQILTAMTLWTTSAAINGFAAITQVAGFTALAGALEGTRATGLTVHANDLGGACAVALVPALMMATSALPGRRGSVGLARIPRWVILGLIACGIVLSGSVTAMAAGFVAIIVWTMAPAVRAPGRLAVVVGLAFALLAIALVGGKVSSPTQRVAVVTSSNGTLPGTGTVDVRIRTVQQALPRIEGDPVMGVGFDGAGGAVQVIDKGQSRAYQVHSAPVAAWYEAGILGLVGLLVVAFTLARASWSSLAGGDENDTLIGLAIFAAGIAFVIVALTSPFVFQQYGWFAAVMAVAWWSRRQESARPADVIVTPVRRPQTIRMPLPQPVSR